MEAVYLLFVFVDGQAEVAKGSGRITSLERGQCFGERSLPARCEGSTSVVTVGTARVLFASSRTLRCAPHGCQVAFERVLVRTLVERLAQNTSALSLTRSKLPEGRVAEIPSEVFSSYRFPATEAPLQSCK